MYKNFIFYTQRVIFSFLILFSISLSLLAADVDNKTDSQKIDPDQLAASFQQILENIISETNVPGGVAAFVLADGRYITVAAGLADIEAGIVMKPHSRMLSASIGKSFVGTTALSMAMDGIINLDAPISNWLGDKAWFSRLPNASDITLRHLLQHRSGLANHVFLPEYAEAVTSGKIDLETSPAVENLVDFVLDREPLFPAGEGYAYTDTGYLLVGLIIEKATEGTYYGVLRRRVLDPLGLTLTSPSDHKQLPGLVPGYMPVENLFGLPPKTLNEQGELVYDPAFEWTGGGLVSNAGDIARYAKELYEGRAMKGDYLPQLLEPKPTSPDRSETAYGLGQGIKLTEFGMAYGHSGWIPGYTSFMAYFADYGIAIAAQFNMSPDSDAGPTPVALGRKLLPPVIINAIKKQTRRKPQ